MAEQVLSAQNISKSVAEYVSSKLKLGSVEKLNELMLAELKKLPGLLKSATEPKPVANKKEETKFNGLDKLPALISQTIKAGFKSLTGAAPKQENPSTKDDIVPQYIKNIPELIKAGFQAAAEPKSKLEKEEKPQITLLGGFTEAGYRDFKEKWKDIDKKEKLPEQPKEKGGALGGLLGAGLLTILAGAGVILGGLAALVKGFTEDGPMKGTLEAIGKAGLKGGLVVLAKKLFGATIKTALKRIPIIGTLISYGFAWQRFKNGDTVGGLIDLTSGTVGLLDLVAPGLGTTLSLGLDVLQAVLDAKAGGSDAKASEKKADILKGWLGDIGTWMSENLRNIPIIGPAVKAVEYFANKEWLQGLKQLAYINPGFELIGALLGDEDVGKGTAVVAKSSSNLAASLGEWVYEKTKDIPIVSKLIEAVGHFQDGNWLQGFKALPGAESVASFFESIDKGLDKASSATNNAINGAVDYFTDMKNSILSNILQYVPETIAGYPLRAKVAEILGIGPKTIDKKPDIKPSVSSEPEQSPANPEPSPQSKRKPKETPTTQFGVVGDAAIDPNGGLLVSSPTLGSLYQINKNDGIIAAPVVENPNPTTGNSFSKAESILERIAGNTAATTQNMSNLISGFNNLARALEKTLGESVKIPQVVNVSGGQQNRPTSYQYASLGNSDITNFRSSIVEGSRFQPA